MEYEGKDLLWSFQKLKTKYMKWKFSATGQQAVWRQCSVRKEKQKRWVSYRNACRQFLQGRESKMCPEVSLRWQDRVENLGGSWWLRITEPTTGDETAVQRGERPAQMKRSGDLKMLPLESSVDYCSVHPCWETPWGRTRNQREGSGLTQTRE